MSTPEADQLASGYRKHHVQMLVIAVLVIAASMVLRVSNDGLIQIGSGVSFQAPSLCASRSLFGVDCPGCGLTRSFVLLGHGRWSESLAMNRVGWLLALAVVLQLPYRAMAIARREALPLGFWIPKLFGWALIAALIGNWALRQCGL